MTIKTELTLPSFWRIITTLEKLLSEHDEWKSFLKLYNHIKSSIYYSAGLKGLFEKNVRYNIETLVNTLYELERNEHHPLYPFIASWNSRLVALAEADFSKVKRFRQLILKQLKNWVSPDDPTLADYYKGLIQIQRGLTFPLRVFSLNYDLCVERLNSLEFRVETGFSGVGPRFIWDWERFEDSESGPTLPQIYLYKLHGSINWKRDIARNLFCLEQIENIQPENMEVIFGRDFKLEAADPYLFYAYEFRKYSLLAKLIVCVGYGFGDDHINKILSQTLRDDENRRLLIIADVLDNILEVKETKRLEIKTLLDAKESQVVLESGNAKGFLETPDLSTKLLALIPPSADSPF